MWGFSQYGFQTLFMGLSKKPTCGDYNIQKYMMYISSPHNYIYNITKTKTTNSDFAQPQNWF